jgi:carbon-monoxide dehydrogenase large subunit
LFTYDQLRGPFEARLKPASSWQTELDNGTYAPVMERCLQEFHWDEKKKLQGQLIDGRYHGIAVANFVEGGAGGQRENARMTIETDGSVAVSVGSTALGQGLKTVMSQIAFTCRTASPCVPFRAISLDFCAYASAAHTP